LNLVPSSGVTRGGKGGHLPPGAALWGRQIEVGILRTNYEISIQQTQDAASGLWVYPHNSWHAAWPTVILSVMETRWKTLALSPRKLN